MTKRDNTICISIIVIAFITLMFLTSIFEGFEARCLLDAMSIAIGIFIGVVVTLNNDTFCECKDCCSCNMED